MTRTTVVHRCGAGARTWLFAVCAAGLLSFPTLSRAAGQLPEPGPESAGMRLRLVIFPEGTGTNETFKVRVDLINVTDQSIKLVGDWRGDFRDGDYKEYLESDVRFQIEPPNVPSMDQVGDGGKRTKPQPEFTLGASKLLTLDWTALGRCMRTGSDLRLPMDGLYSIHASVLLRLAENERTIQPAPSAPSNRILLRSNEQLVPVGGSHALPKHTLGKLISADTNRYTAAIDIGSVHKTVVGDQFWIHTGYIGQNWNLKITKVDPTVSFGVLEPILKGQQALNSRLLKPGALVEWIAKDDQRHR